LTIVQRLAVQIGLLLADGLVVIVHIGLVVLAMVDLHGLGVDVRFERAVGVRQGLVFERHVFVSFRCE
jgi:hypothetical protein